MKTTGPQILPGALTISLAGQELILLPERAVWWPNRSTLFVADVHFGKEAAFRAAAIPVPDQTAGLLHRLSEVVCSTGAIRLVVLGDLIHARRGRCPLTFDQVSRWRESNYGQLDVLLVRGNHDLAAGDPPTEWRIHCIPDPSPLAPFSLNHMPPEDPQVPTLCGHLHPVVRLRGPARDSLRLPCFLRTAETLVLPAFSTFVDGRIAALRSGDHVFAIADNEVIGIPGGTEAKKRSALIH